MSNPFSGILTAEFKTLFTNSIDALVEAAGCAVTCRILYGNTKFNSCENCLFNAAGNKSANRYLSGGSVPFRNGQTCPVCRGVGKIPDEQTEDIELIVIWDSKSFVNLGHDNTALTPNMFAQTFCAINKYPKLKRAKEIILDTDKENYVRQRFTIYGEPEPCGFDGSQYILTTWKRISGA